MCIVVPRDPFPLSEGAREYHGEFIIQSQAIAENSLIGLIELVLALGFTSRLFGASHRYIHISVGYGCPIDEDNCKDKIWLNYIGLWYSENFIFLVKTDIIFCEKSVRLMFSCN